MFRFLIAFLYILIFLFFKEESIKMPFVELLKTNNYIGKFLKVSSKEIGYIEDDLDIAEKSNWSFFNREIVEVENSVAILPIHKDKSVTLIEQYRAPVGDYIFEVPAGKVENGNIFETAQKELKEEVGLKSTSFYYIGKCYASPGYSTEEISLYLAFDVKETDWDPQGIEEQNIKVLRFSRSIIKANVKLNRFHDMKTLLLLQAYLRYLDNVRY